MTAITANTLSVVADTTRLGAVTGAPAPLLRLEAAAVMLGAGFGYHLIHANWLMFALLFLVPDLSILGYLAGRRIGAAVYNAGHSYLLPVALAVAGFSAHAAVAYALAMIWTAHIGFDRMLGYGLKYPAGFGVTHLGFKTGRQTAKTGA